MEKCFYKYRQLVANEDPTKLHPFTLSLIQKGELYFPFPSTFNDPFDGVIEYSKTIDITAIKSWLTRIPTSLEEKEWILRACQQNAEKLPQMYASGVQNLQQKEFLRIYCLSTNPVNILMWAYYAAGHSGLCVGFKAHQLYEGSWGIKVHSECLSRSYQLQFSNILFPFPVNYTSIVPSKYDFGQGNLSAITESFLNKAIEWEKEQECRIIIPDDDLLQNPVVIDVNEIEEIIFGLRASPLLIKQVKEIVSKSPYKQPGPQLYQCKRIQGTYSLEKVLLPL